MSENQVYSIGPLMKAARKFKKLNQADVAQAIGCSQSALSKMEHNLLVPSAPQWFLFSRFTSIPPAALETGFIDRHAPVKFNDTNVSLGFKIPKRYRQYRATKVRELYPFLFALEKISKDLSLEFINSTGLDPEFFLDFDNLINFHLLTDVVNFYIQHGKSSADDVKKIVDYGQNDIYWNHYKAQWKKLGSLHLSLAEYARDQIFFQTDFQLKVEGDEDKITLSFFPEYHLKQLGPTVSSELLEFLNLYRKFSIENLLKHLTGRDITATLIQESQSSPLGARFEVA